MRDADKSKLAGIDFDPVVGRRERKSKCLDSLVHDHSFVRHLGIRGREREAERERGRERERERVRE